MQAQATTTTVPNSFQMSAIAAGTDQFPTAPAFSGVGQRLGGEPKPRYFAGLSSAFATATSFIQKGCTNISNAGKALYNRGISAVVDDTLHITINTVEKALIGTAIGSFAGLSVSWYNPILATGFIIGGACIGGTTGAILGFLSAVHEVSPEYHINPETERPVNLPTPLTNQTD